MFSEIEKRRDAQLVEDCLAAGGFPVCGEPSAQRPAPSAQRPAPSALKGRSRT